MPEATIAVYTCVKNEQKHAQRWWDANKDADYLLWLDTGSTDNTERAAQDAGITYVHGLVDPFRFDDARNAALAFIPPDIDYCIQVDADEVLDEGWHDKWLAAPAHKRYSYRLINGLGTGWKDVWHSNLHARRGFRWKHPIHETIVGPQATHKLDLTVTHHPDTTKPRKQYMDLLRMAVAEDPHSPRMQFYLARELYQAGKWKDGRTEMQKFLNMDGVWGAERGEGYRLMGKMTHEPVSWLIKAVAAEPARREPYVDLARWYVKHRKGKEALAWLLLAEQRTNPGVYTTEGYAWGASFEALAKQIRSVN